MESPGQILEEELANSFQVKDERALHRSVILLVENLARQNRNEREHSEFREAIIRIDTRIEEGFKRMDERFSSVDKRFDDVNKRFSMMFTFITIGFVTLATLMSVYQFL